MSTVRDVFYVFDVEDISVDKYSISREQKGFVCDLHKTPVVTFFRQPALAQCEQVAYFRSSQYTEMLGKSHLCLGKKFTKPYTNFWGL